MLATDIQDAVFLVYIWRKKKKPDLCWSVDLEQLYNNNISL